MLKALESAARVVGVFASTGEAPLTGERRIRKGRQERNLEASAKQHGFRQDELIEFRCFEPGGEEHRVSFPGDVFLKATHPGY
jgi:hypothetical protein